MSVLLDTCVLSEIRKAEGSPAVKAAVARLAPDRVFLSVLTVGEVANGIARLADGAKRRGLALWFDGLLLYYADRILGVDVATARLWGEMTATAPQAGHSVAVADGLIAATALRHGLDVMTRNVGDFAPTGVRVIDPWPNEEQRG